jgi:hypothetical protein
MVGTHRLLPSDFGVASVLSCQCEGSAIRSEADSDLPLSLRCQLRPRCGAATDDGFRTEQLDQILFGRCRTDRSNAGGWNDEPIVRGSLLWDLPCARDENAENDECAYGSTSG